jgi:hypothetical protein
VLQGPPTAFPFSHMYKIWGVWQHAPLLVFQAHSTVRVPRESRRTGKASRDFAPRTALAHERILVMLSSHYRYLAALQRYCVELPSVARLPFAVGGDGHAVPQAVRAASAEHAGDFAPRGRCWRGPEARWTALPADGFIVLGAHNAQGNR